MHVLPTPRLTLPSATRAAKAAGLDAYDLVSYDAAYERSQRMRDPHHSHRTKNQMLGHPTPVQYDPDEGDGRGEDLNLLLAVHDDSATPISLADNGAIYYLISSNAVARQAWNEVYADAQSG